MMREIMIPAFMIFVAGDILGILTFMFIEWHYEHKKKIIKFVPQTVEEMELFNMFGPGRMRERQFADLYFNGKMDDFIKKQTEVENE